MQASAFIGECEADLDQICGGKYRVYFAIEQQRRTDAAYVLDPTARHRLRR